MCLWRSTKLSELQGSIKYTESTLTSLTSMASKSLKAFAQTCLSIAYACVRTLCALMSLEGRVSLINPGSAEGTNSCSMA